jgi:P-type conjugative transfer protein TrbJ
MRRSPKRTVLAAFVTLPLTMAALPEPAHAQQAVECVNCADFTTQLLQYAKEAASLESQLQSHITQLQQYANMIQNTMALPMQIWGTVQSDIMQIRNLANMVSLLSGNSGSMISRLQSAMGYAGSVARLPSQISNQITTWQQTAGDNLNAFARTIGVQQDQQASDAALLASLQAHAQTAAGQMQALNAANELAGASALQLLKIQSTINAQAQVQAAQLVIQNDRQATQDAALQRFMEAPLFQTTGGRRY